MIGWPYSGNSFWFKKGNDNFALTVDITLGFLGKIVVTFLMHKLRILSLIHHFPLTVEPTVIWVFLSLLCENYFVVLIQGLNEANIQWTELSISWLHSWLFHPGNASFSLASWWHTFPPFFFLSRSFSSGSSFFTLLMLECPWTLFLDYIFVFSLSLLPWLSPMVIHVLELNTPLMPVTTKFMSESDWGPARWVHLQLDVLLLFSC